MFINREQYTERDFLDQARRGHQGPREQGRLLRGRREPPVRQGGPLHGHVQRRTGPRTSASCSTTSTPRPPRAKHPSNDRPDSLEPVPRRRHALLRRTGSCFLPPPRRPSQFPRIVVSSPNGAAPENRAGRRSRRLRAQAAAPGPPRRPRPRGRGLRHARQGPRRLPALRRRRWRRWSPRAGAISASWSTAPASARRWPPTRCPACWPPPATPRRWRATPRAQRRQRPHPRRRRRSTPRPPRRSSTRSSPTECTVERHRSARAHDPRDRAGRRDGARGADGAARRGGHRADRRAGQAAARPRGHAGASGPP